MYVPRITVTPIQRNNDTAAYSAHVCLVNPLTKYVDSDTVRKKLFPIAQFGSKRDVEAAARKWADEQVAGFEPKRAEPKKDK